jgi:hypothetical protein
MKLKKMKGKTFIFKQRKTRKQMYETKVRCALVNEASIGDGSTIFATWT